MSKNPNIIGKISFGSGLALLLAIAVGWSVVAYAADEQHADHQDPAVTHLDHISTQAEAEALKPGDTIAMACSKCKHIMLQRVTDDNSHVKLMTVGEKHKCVCGGVVTVTGKGEGKKQDVNHVCSKCGDDAMFVCATTLGSGQSHKNH